MAILIVNQIWGKYVTLLSEIQSKERFQGNHLTSELKQWQRRGLDISLLTHLFSLLNTQAWTHRAWTIFSCPSAETLTDQIMTGIIYTFRR